MQTWSFQSKIIATNLFIHHRSAFQLNRLKMAQRHSSKSYDNCNRQYVLSYADLKFSVGDHSSSIQKLCRALLTSETSSNPNTQNKNGKEKIIINGISGSARSGQMISVMGPSGAGKVCTPPPVGATGGVCTSCW